MAELVPLSLEALLRRVLAEHSKKAAIFDLPARSYWQGSPRDLSVRFHGARASTAAGPAAGPQSQLAQNVALSWLAGSRIVELKTVQIDDRLAIPRPCIDAANVGYNVEWSQELRLEQSLEEYVKAWMLIHALQKLNPAGLRPSELDTLFDFSVGYSLAGIRSDRVARWLDGLRDAGPLIQRQRDKLPTELRPWVDMEIPSQISECLTLSTFHGCPADEIERIVEHLYERHALHVVVKMNPTLLGLEVVEGLLNGQMGYADIRVHAPAFEHDLQWDQALQMLTRLETASARAGKTLGVKLTNTLVVENHKAFFPGSEKMMYLSGQPLHVLAIALASRFAAATGGRYPLSFSAGIDKSNFAEVVACGLTPVTTCTDLLRPGGYGRMSKYFAPLEAEMERARAASTAELTAKRGGMVKALEEYSRRVAADVRYSAAKNSSVPRRIGTTLVLFDCINCDKCIQVCPNDANFSLEVPGVGPTPAIELVVEAGGLVRLEEAGTFQLKDQHQLANFADLCNECGNCDIFCPEEGGPYKVKPRFFSGEGTYRQDRSDGFFIGPDDMVGRIGGAEHRLWVDGDRAEFSDGRITARLEMPAGRLIEATAHLGAPQGHRLSLWKFHAMRALRDGVLAGINPISAAATP